MTDALQNKEIFMSEGDGEGGNQDLDALKEQVSALSKQLEESNGKVTKLATANDEIAKERSTFKEQLREMKDKSLKENGDVDSLRKMIEERDGKIETLTNTYKSKEKSFHVTQELLGLGIQKDMLPKAKKLINMDEVAFDSEGNPIGHDAVAKKLKEEVPSFFTKPAAQSDIGPKPKAFEGTVLNPTEEQIAKMSDKELVNLSMARKKEAEKNGSKMLPGMGL